MGLLSGVYQYYLQNQTAFLQAAGQHIFLSFTALGAALLVCLPLGVWIAHRAGLAQVTLNLMNGLRVVPSLVILFLTLPYLGIGALPALLALSILAAPPILINTSTGVRSVDPAVVEAAYGTGMTFWQVLWRIKLPLAAPAILAGIRTAAVEVIASATLAAFIGGGGLGDFITRGFALYDARIMLAGALPVAALALASEAVISLAMLAGPKS